MANEPKKGVWMLFIFCALPRGLNVYEWKTLARTVRVQWLLGSCLKKKNRVECKLWLLTPWLRYILWYFHFLKFHFRKNDFVRLMFVGISVNQGYIRKVLSLSIQNPNQSIAKSISWYLIDVTVVVGEIQFWKIHWKYASAARLVWCHCNPMLYFSVLWIIIK